MDAGAPDRDLVGRYAREGSEAAFRALVTRHVDLVFATAVRQVGDAGLAEEVTQNVFVTLARKAPRLAGHETIAGWLHRTALLEAKARIRSELRRRRRETAAAALATLERDGVAPTDDLTPLLDEGLLGLRDTDRLALVLRFLEQRSLREVGTILGIDEDAARKRVGRALERLTGFFRARGFAVPASGGAVVLGQAVQAAPAGLAASAAGAGLAAGTAAGGLNLLLLPLMTFGKIPAVAVGAALLVVPLWWQGRALADARRTAAGLAAEQAELEARLAAASTESVRLEDGRREAEILTRAAEERWAALSARRAGPSAPAEPYRWNDASTLARVPKAMLRKIEMSGVANRRGQLREQVLAALQFTGNEAAAVQAAIDRFVGRYQALIAASLHRVEPTPSDLRGHPPEEVRVFEVRGIQEGVAALREGFFADLRAVLEAERFDLLVRSLEDWMPVNDGYRGFNSGMGIFADDHRVRYFPTPQAADGELRLGWGLEVPGRGGVTAVTEVDDVPEAIRPHVKDLIDRAIAEREAAIAVAATNGVAPVRQP